MKPIFNRRGWTIGWLYNGVIFDRNNRCRAFVLDGYVYTYASHYIGVVQKGIFRDTRGQCIAYMDDASYDPMLPIPEITPVPPSPSAIPPTPFPPSPPKAPPPLSYWSPLHWDTYLDG